MQTGQLTSLAFLFTGGKGKLYIDEIRIGQVSDYEEENIFDTGDFMDGNYFFVFRKKCR